MVVVAAVVVAKLELVLDSCVYLSVCLADIQAYCSGCSCYSHPDCILNAAASVGGASAKLVLPFQGWQFDGRSLVAVVALVQEVAAAAKVSFVDCSVDVAFTKYHA